MTTSNGVARVKEREGLHAFWMFNTCFKFRGDTFFTQV